MPRLEAGHKAPAFTLPDQDEKKVSLKDFAGVAGRRLLLSGRRHPRVHQGGVPVQREPVGLQSGRGRRSWASRPTGGEAPQVQEKYGLASRCSRTRATR